MIADVETPRGVGRRAAGFGESPPVFSVQVRSNHLRIRNSSETQVAIEDRLLGGFLGPFFETDRREP